MSSFLDFENEFKDIVTIINGIHETNQLNPIEETKDLKKLFRTIFDLYDLVYPQLKADELPYINELYRNLCDVLFLGLVSKINVTQFILRANLELFAKLEYKRTGNIVKRKFSDNINLVVKELKEGKKRDKQKLVNKKEEIQDLYGRYCGVVHIEDVTKINPHETLEERINIRYNNESFSQVIDDIQEMLNLMLELDIMLFYNFYFNNISPQKLDEYKRLYLTDCSKEYCFNISEPK